jgi:beta-phosphoglucomutase-like phosphatase (HAD superfamily)
MLARHPLKAVLWDFDGTMADTRRRNLNVNRRIFGEITGRRWQEVAALTSAEAYLAAWNRVRNWRELYTSAFGLTDDQCARAARMWAPCQIEDSTPVPLFDGVEEALDDLRLLPQAVVSQNDRTIIERILKDAGVAHFFAAIIGYAEVRPDRQKPAPDGLLQALDILGIEEPASALSIGDHETDTLCAVNANRDLVAMGRDLRVISVAAGFVDGNSSAEWSVAPDCRVDRPGDLRQLVRRYSVN